MEFQHLTDMINMIPEGFSISEDTSAYNHSEIALSVVCYRTSDPSQAKLTLKIFPRAQAAGAVASDLAQRERLMFLKARGPFAVKISNEFFATEYSICLVLEHWGRNLCDLITQDSLAAPPQCNSSAAKLTKLALQRQVNSVILYIYIYYRVNIFANI